MEAIRNPMTHDLKTAAPSAVISAEAAGADAVPEIKVVTDLDGIPDGYDIADGGDVIYVIPHV